MTIATGVISGLLVLGIAAGVRELRARRRRRKERLEAERRANEPPLIGWIDWP